MKANVAFPNDIGIPVMMHFGESPFRNDNVKGAYSADLCQSPSYRGGPD